MKSSNLNFAKLLLSESHTVLVCYRFIYCYLYYSNCVPKFPFEFACLSLIILPFLFRLNVQHFLSLGGI